jgi:hypothetical protein
MNLIRLSRSVSFGLSFFAAALSAQSAYANDTSFPTIDVDAIETNTAVGSYMSFSGKEATKLMGVLPKVQSVLGPDLDNHRAALHVKSPGYQISISCTDLNLQASAANGGPARKTPQCHIYFGNRVDEGNEFAFNPEKQCK